MNCPECGTDNPPDAKFCSVCAARLDMTCPQCGRPNPAGAKFCGGCGAQLSVGATPTPDVGATEPTVPAPGAQSRKAEFLAHIPLAPAVEPEPPWEPPREPAPPTQFAPADPPPLAEPQSRRQPGLWTVVGAIIVLEIIAGGGFLLWRSIGRGDHDVKPAAPKAAPVAPVVSKPVPAPKAAAPKPPIVVAKPKLAPPAKPQQKPRRRSVVAHRKRHAATPRKKPLTAAQKEVLHRKQALETAKRSEAILKKRAAKYRREHPIEGRPIAPTRADEQVP